MSPRDPMLRVRDMLEAANRILERASGSREALAEDETLQVWVVYHLQVLGEAASAVPAEIANAHPEVDWVALRGMRNRLVHGYFDVDLDVIWEAVVRDVPVLRDQVAGILHDADAGF